MTVAEFDANARKAAATLSRRGIIAGDRVALMAGNSPDLLAATYGIWLLGAVEVAVNTELKGPLLHHVLRDSDPILILADNDMLARIGEAAPSLKAIELTEAFEVSAGVDENELPAPEALASLLYTSGTTGASKGVMIPHAYFSYFAHTQGAVFGISATDTCYFTLPFFHIDAHIALPTCLRWGSSLAFNRRFSVRVFWEEFVRFEATWFGAIGSMLSALVSRGRPPQLALDRLRLIVAAPVPQDAFDAFDTGWGIPVLQMYGQTEANGPLYSTVERNRHGAVGWPCAGFEIRVVGADGQDVGRGEAGELLTKPAEPNARALGYWRRPEATAAAFVDGWFHTGDVVRQDAEDFVWYLGRKTDSLRRRGENISSFELEQVLARAPGVTAVAALGVRDQLGGEDEIKAVLTVDDSFDVDRFAEFSIGNLPRFAVPRYVEVVSEEQLVRGPGTGAIQKHLLPQGITAATREIHL